MLSSVIGDRMQNYDLIGGPLADGALWRGALFWALALYIPLSGPPNRLEDSLGNSSIPEQWRQLILVSSSLLVALVTGLIAQHERGFQPTAVDDSEDDIDSVRKAKKTRPK